MVSVVIAAHNEGAVIGRCLDSLLLRSAESGSIQPSDIVVAANGCSDETARISRERGVVVLDLPNPGKTAALNAAEQVAQGFPRVYLDADIVLTPQDLDRLITPLDTPTASGRAVAAVVPRREVDMRGCGPLVRSYFQFNAVHPSYRDGLFGRGVIAMSASGRSRFTAFPDVLGDDLFLDSLFSPEEKAEVSAVASIVAAPHRTIDLLRRMARVRRGNAQLRATNTARPRSDLRWLRIAVRENPRLAPKAAVYVALTTTAAVLARSGRTGWAQDRSTRSPKMVAR